MTLIKATSWEGRIYLFGPFVTEAEKQHFVERIKDAWFNPNVQEVKVNDPQEPLGLSEGFDA